MPVMVAVIASRLCDMEIKGGTLKLLFTLSAVHPSIIVNYCTV